MDVQTYSAAIAASEDIVPVVAENTYSIAATTGGEDAVARELSSVAATTAAGARARAQGTESVAAATGSKTYAVARELSSVAAVTGRRSTALAGYMSVAAATGEGAEAHAGEFSLAAATGYWVRAIAKGYGAMAMAHGPRAKAVAHHHGTVAVTTEIACGAHGSVLVFVRPGDANTPAIVKTVRVGEQGIEPFTPYRLNDAGEVEVAPLNTWDNPEFLLED